jgi:hypothetical protein
MAGFIFDARATLSEIQDSTPATVATTATKHAFEPELSQLSQLSQPLPGENAMPDADAFQERAAIIHEAHTRIIADDRAQLPVPIFEITREQAERMAARKQGFDDADSLHNEAVRRWAAEIERLAKLRAVSPEGTKALKRARAFITERWALQAARLGWDEVELFGVCPRAPWRRLDPKGAAFGGAVQAVTAEAVTYVGGLRRYRATENNDGSAVPIWELAQNSQPSEGDVAND